MPRAQQPNAIRLAYYRALRKVIAHARSLVARDLLPQLPGLVAEAAAERGDSEGRGDAGGASRTDAPLPPGQRVNAIMDAVTREFDASLSQNELHRLAALYAQRTSDLQREQLERQIRAAVGVEVPLGDPQLGPRIRQFTAENVALIQSIPAAYFDKVEAVTLAGVRTGARASEIAADIQDVYGVSDSRAQLIANDQIGKFYGEMNQARQEDIGVDAYFWRTSGDERVRDEHTQREGERFAWDDPPEDGHPGQPINCRCYADPDLSEILGEL